MPDSRKRKSLCNWPHVGEPKRGFSSKQKRWVVLNLKTTSLALLEVVQTAMRRTAKEKPVDFLWHEVQKTLVGIYPYDPARNLSWRDMVDLEAEPRVKVEPLSPTQDRRNTRSMNRWQRRDDAMVVNYCEEVEDRRSRPEKRDRLLRVALFEAPSALDYDPEAPPSDIRSRLGPLTVRSSATEEQSRGTEGLTSRGSDAAQSAMVEMGRDAPAPPHHLKEERRAEREKRVEGPRDGVAEATLTCRNRRTLKRYFTTLTSLKTALYPKTFLRPMLCHQCDQKVHQSELCWVTLWKEGAALPRNKTMPCIYCRSRQHAVDACSSLHHRCEE